jgi:hypothetical protein
MSGLKKPNARTTSVTKTAHAAAGSMGHTRCLLKVQMHHLKIDACCPMITNLFASLHMFPYNSTKSVNSAAIQIPACVILPGGTQRRTKLPSSLKSLTGSLFGDRERGRSFVTSTVCTKSQDKTYESSSNCVNCDQ